MHLRNKLQRALEREGWGGTLRLIGRNLVLLSKRPFLKPVCKDSFDELYNVETATPIGLSELEIDSPNYAFGSAYGAVTPNRLRMAMECLKIDHERFTFVDLGSGKGRALLLAAAWPFRRIIGVEFSQQLHEVAVRNIANYTGPVRCTDIRSVCEDATRFVFPLEPLVIYLFNPFVGKTMMQVLRNIEQSFQAAPREMYLLYVNPKMDYAIQESSYFRPMTKDKLHCVYQCVEQVGEAGAA